MSTPEGFDNETTPEKLEKLFSPDILTSYLTSQFISAFEKEQGSDSRGRFEPNGSFYQSTPLAIDSEELTQGAVRIVLVPPIQLLARRQRRNYAEIYALPNYDEQGKVVDGDNEIVSNQFLVRIKQNGKLSKFSLVDNQGVYHPRETKIDAILNKLNKAHEAQDIIKQAGTIIQKSRRSERLYSLLRNWNITAITNN